MSEWKKNRNFAFLKGFKKDSILFWENVSCKRCIGIAQFYE